MRDGRVGEGGADLAVYVGDSVLRWYLGQVGSPFDAARGLELSPGLVRQFQKWPQRRMVDNEVHLRPVLGGLADIVHRRVLPDVGERFFVVRWQKSLVNADGRDAGFDRLLVE